MIDIQQRVFPCSATSLPAVGRLFSHKGGLHEPIRLRWQDGKFLLAAQSSVQVVLPAGVDHGTSKSACLWPLDAHQNHSNLIHDTSVYRFRQDLKVIFDLVATHECGTDSDITVAIRLHYQA